MRFNNDIGDHREKMDQRTLITYATRTQSTAEIAAIIWQTLSTVDETVDILPVKKVTDLENYRAIILGSAVKYGKWLPEALHFVEKNRTAIKKVPLAIFSVHLMNLGDDETSRQRRETYLSSINNLVNPEKKVFFAGIGNWEKVPFMEGIIGKMIKAPEGDFRDWPAIRNWAEELRDDKIFR